jgi:primosomal protein N' (replication factor Y)
MPFVEVAIPLGIRQTFSYSVPAPLIAKIKPGARVLVPFGRKLLTGFVVSTSAEQPPAGFTIRPVRDILDREPAVSPELIETALWVAKYYFAPPGEVFRALFPAGHEVTGSERVRLSGRAMSLMAGGLRPGGLRREAEQILDALFRQGPASIKRLAAEAGIRSAAAWVESLVLGGWAEIEDTLDKPKIGVRQQLGLRAIPATEDALSGLTATQGRLYRNLPPDGKLIPLQDVLRQTGCTAAVAHALVAAGVAEIAPVRIERIPLDLADTAALQPIKLTKAQGAALEGLRQLLSAGAAERCLLHGVTGSGKTEVYLRLIAEVLTRGDSALFLVPEIGLTPLLCRVVLAHFPGRVSVLHSGMSAGERFDQWLKIREGKSPVVVGTRSAVFAPVPRLRLVILDEEQDASYKQDESPCYHAREVAWHRIRQASGLLLMGSATPSVETYHAAKGPGQIGCFSLPERIEARPLPQVEVVDMGQEFQRKGKRTVLSHLLQSELAAVIERGEQAIVLLNRRGYSRSLLCRSCGQACTCPDCSVSLTYHQEDGRLICHYCGREEATPSACTSCGGQYIYFVGVGTEQLEEIVRRVIPQARVARVDRDVGRRRGAIRKILLDFSARRLDVLVGTQIVAKGHDFPNVTLVGVVGADSGLAFPDFRSAERTFQLLTQVAGRAGRGSIPGRVVIQSFYPDHYALTSAKQHDFSAFFAREIEFRRQLGYPPFCNMVQILVTDSELQRAFLAGEKIAAALKRCRDSAPPGSGCRVLGPAAAPLEKLRGKYRVQLLLKLPAGTSAAPLLETAFGLLAAEKVPLAGVHVDVDPLSLL